MRNCGDLKLETVLFGHWNPEITSWKDRQQASVFTADGFEVVWETWIPSQIFQLPTSAH